MLKLNFIKNQNYLIKPFLIILPAILIVGCNGGNNAISNNQIKNAKQGNFQFNQLMSPVSDIHLKIGSNTANQPQLITHINRGTAIGESVTIESVTVDFYSGPGCTGDIYYSTRGGISHANIGIDYSTSDQSNYALCSSYPEGTGGCEQVFTDIQSLKVTYRYTFAPSTTQICIPGPIQNNGQACTESSSCGFTAEQTLSITPGAKMIVGLRGPINGNLGGFTGADQICVDSDTNPLGAGQGSWKALLNTNEATTNGISYIWPDGTEIATATSGNLNYGDGDLTNILLPGGGGAWTGADGNDCNLWTSSSSQLQGGTGDGTVLTDAWFNNGNLQCSNNNSVGLYCVQQ